MSRGPGTIETRITELFAATRDRALSVGELADHAFALGGARPTRTQRLSATRAAHRVIGRRRGLEAGGGVADEVARRVLAALSAKLGYVEWRATTIGRGRGARLWFHPADVPVQIWAVAIDRGGVHWFEAELVRVTQRNAIVRYAGAVARLDRGSLLLWWAWWRGVRFVSRRSGGIAAELEEIWWKRYGPAGSPPPAMQMPLADAIAMLGVPRNYTREDVIAAFRWAVKKAHPDLGGTAEDFRRLVEARDRLLAAIGTRAPPPRMPAYYPSGTTIVYRSGGSAQRRLGQTRRLAHGTG